MNEEIRPFIKECPFCKSPVDKENIGYVNTGYETIFSETIVKARMVQCGKCGTNGPHFKISKISELDFCLTQEDAIKAWNTR